MKTRNLFLLMLVIYPVIILLDELRPDLIMTAVGALFAMLVFVLAGFNQAKKDRTLLLWAFAVVIALVTAVGFSAPIITLPVPLIPTHTPGGDRTKKPPQAIVLLRQVDRRVLKLPSMWTRSYFAATVGNVSALIIEKYIAAQKGL